MGDELKLTHSGRGVATARGQQWLQEGGGHGWVWRGRSLRRVSTACRGTAGPWVFRERGGQGPPGRTRRTPKLHQPGGVGERAASSHRAEKKLVLGEAPCLGKKLKEGVRGDGARQTCAGGAELWQTQGKSAKRWPRGSGPAKWTSGAGLDGRQREEE